MKRNFEQMGRPYPFTEKDIPSTIDRIMLRCDCGKEKERGYGSITIHFIKDPKTGKTASVAKCDLCGKILSRN